MADNVDILKSLQDELVQKENEFNSYTEELRRLEDEMKTIQHNYETQKQNLTANIERVRGAYTVVYNQLKKFGAIKEEPVEQPKQEEKSKQEEKPKAPKKTAEKKSEEPKEEKKEKVVAGLTKEEIEKINKAVTKPDVKDDKGNEIPEYLQTEYNK